jgi:glutamyl-tRNA synthetase
MAFKTRFAPSPTGYLHLGSARTTLFTALFSAHHNGSWFIRIEDTDQNRLVPDAFIQLLENLETLGLLPDEGVTLQPVGSFDSFYNVHQYGDNGPYIQSQRKDVYHEHAQQLIDKGLCYWDYLSPEQRQELQELKKATKQPIQYFEVNKRDFGEDLLHISIQEAQKKEHKPALRFRLQRDEQLTTHDLLMGESTFNLRLEEDPVFLKSDGFPTYHLAHLVDDKLMGTTHVIRSQEWYSSLPLHTQMFKDYWGESLTYIHIPFILGEQGNKKMSKRDGDVNMQDYLDQGYLPEAIINYLAFLGWNPGTDKELYLESTDF